MHLSILINGIVSYTEYAGLEIPVNSAVARWTLKTEMLVPNCTGAYGRKGLFRTSQVVSLHQIINYLKDKIGVVFFRCCVIFSILCKGITHATAHQPFAELFVIMCARKMRLLYMIPICSNSVPILHRTTCPPPSPSQRDATPRTNTAAGYITAGYITDPDTHREQRGPLSDF